MTTATVAGLLLIALSISFNSTFALLAARFDYPDILRQPTADVLAKFRAGGTPLVLLWWAFALTALLMVPLVVLLSSAISDAAPTLVSLATTVGVLGAAVQFLGLIRWPFLVSLPRPDGRRPPREPHPAGGGRHRPPVLQPLPRRRGRRASWLPPHRSVDHPGRHRAHPDVSRRELDRHARYRHRPRAHALLTGVRGAA